jgi:hypothetical protein
MKLGVPGGGSEIERLAVKEKNEGLKLSFLEQASAYRKLAEKSACLWINREPETRRDSRSSHFTIF